jgi:hypothetical protein
MMDTTFMVIVVSTSQEIKSLEAWWGLLLEKFFFLSLRM